MPPAAELPPELAAAVAAELSGRAPAELQEGSQALTAAYKAGEPSGTGLDFGAYLAARLPATYAAVAAVLRELIDRLPEFRPECVVDAGSGPGTASWAASALWPEISRFTFIDVNRHFLAVATRLARQSQMPALQQAVVLQGDLTTSTAGGDLVIAAYAFAECPADRAGNIALNLWGTAAGALVIVEPGTPQGFLRISNARQALIAHGAWIAAPCPHQGECPLGPPDWCHFSVRLPRSRLHMRTKAATVPFEDERYSYLIATRDRPQPARARILTPPRSNKAGVTLSLCTGEGVRQEHIAKRDKPAYNRARKFDWGDALA